MDWTQRTKELVCGQKRERQREKPQDDGGLLVLLLTRGMTWGNNFTSLCFIVLYKIRVISAFSHDGSE